MSKTNRRGFTLVEMTVVMAIIALISVIGVAALVNLKNGSVVDSASQDILTAIRETQNKAVSVANVPNSSDIPIAWGLELDAATNTMRTFYYTDKNGVFEKSPSDAFEAKSLSPVSLNTTGYLIFSAPFGSYYFFTTEPTLDKWKYREARPKDIIPISAYTAADQSFQVTYKNDSRTVNISANGDAHVQ